MAGYVARRLAQSVVVVIGVLVFVFVLLRVTGDPAVLMLPPDHTYEDELFMRHPSTPAPRRTRSTQEESARERRPEDLLGAHPGRARPGRPGAAARAGARAERARVHDPIGRPDRPRGRPPARLVLAAEGPAARRAAAERTRPPLPNSARARRRRSSRSWATAPPRPT